MVGIFHLCWIIGIIIFTFLYLTTEKAALKIWDIKADEVSYDNAKIALERLSTWATWLTGLQTAAMAAMVLLVNGKRLTEPQADYGFLMLLFFGASIILSTWLLSSIPSAQMRLINSEKPDKKNDIYRMRLFSFVPFTIGRFSGIVHTYFLIGIIFFALFIFSLFQKC